MSQRRAYPRLPYMAGLLILFAVGAVAFLLGRHLFVVGVRNGDRLGDAAVGAANSDDDGRYVSVAVRNPASQPVLVGASVRKRGRGQLGRSGQSVTVPRSTSRAELLAGEQTVVWAIPARETQTVTVPVSRSIRRWGELVVAIGEPDRLRVVRQTVKLPRPDRLPPRRLQPSVRCDEGR